MKLLLIAFLGLSTAAFAAPVKTCNTNVPRIDEEGYVRMEYVISKKGQGLEAKVSQWYEGEKVVMKESVQVATYSVRAGLNIKMDPDKLNDGENLVLHALTLEKDPDLEGRYKSGIKLSAVRSVKVYVVGEITNMGKTAVVEAKDQKGKDLGSFLGGFVVSPCK